MCHSLFLRNILSLIQGIVPNNGISIRKLVRSATDRGRFSIHIINPTGKISVRKLIQITQALDINQFSRSAIFHLNTIGANGFLQNIENAFALSKSKFRFYQNGTVLRNVRKIRFSV